MNIKQWLTLLTSYIVFLLLGSVVFQALEATNDYTEKLDAATKLNEVQINFTMTLQQMESAADQELFYDFALGLQEHTGQPIVRPGYSLEELLLNNSYGNWTVDPDSVHHNWDLWNTFYFTFITITTIGYGHLYPKTLSGQMFCIFYSVFGIPYNTLVFVTLSTFYKNIVLSDEDLKGRNGRSKTTVILRALLYLIPGLIAFLIGPAVVFMFVEGWNFCESVYFAFISLTTIGFGEYVAGHPDHLGGWDAAYKGFIMLWTMFGLSYIIMVVGFVLAAFTSKKVRKVSRMTRKRILRVKGLLQEIVNTDHGESASACNIDEGSYKKKDGDKGFDNEGYVKSESLAVPETKKNNLSNGVARRNSFIEMFQDEYRRQAILRRSTSSQGKRKTSSSVEDQTNENEIKNLSTLIDAVAELLDNEYGSDEDEKQDNKPNTKNEVQLNEVGRNHVDTTIHI